MQQVRIWVRQLQQQQQQREQEQLERQQQQQQQLEASQAPASIPALQQAGIEVAESAAEDQEVLQLIQELNQGAAEGGPGSSSSNAKVKAGKSPAAAARRSLRPMLKSLALERV